MEFIYLGMTSTSTVLAVVLMIIAMLYMFNSVVLDRKEGSRFPPGPKGWPIVGNLLHLPAKGWVPKQIQTYGEMFTLKMGTLRVVHLSGKTLKAALTDGHLLSERAPVPAMYDYFHNKGLIGASFHDTWRQQRAFMFKILNHLTFANGKHTFQDRVLQEVESLISEITKKDGQPICIENLLKLATGNVMCSFISGRRYDYDNGIINELVQTIADCVKAFEYGCISIFFPAVKYIPGGGLRGFFQKFDLLRSRQKVDIDEHKANLDRSIPGDFIDYYLMEIERCQNEGRIQGEAGFTEDNLQYVLVDLAMAGTESTSSTVYWGILLLLVNPEVHTKVKEELNRVCDGSEDRAITMADQKLCPYTQAAIMEIQRFATVAPSLMRALTEDSKIGGHHLPKGTMFLLNFLDTHYDDKLWDNPKTFNPDRFLSNDSPGTIVRHDVFMAFSAGRRSCPGEHLAKTELFLFFANMIHRFDISLPLNTATPSTEAQGGFSRIPQPFKACFTPRRSGLSVK